jgi:metal-sulfur cluster biosynthetic enzyme
MGGDFMVSEQAVRDALQQVIDPELGVDIVNLGLIYTVQILPETETVLVDMTLTTPGCPMSDVMVSAAQYVLRSLAGVSTGEVSLVWDPPWHPSMATPLGRAQLGMG